MSEDVRYELNEADLDGYKKYLMLRDPENVNDQNIVGFGLYVKGWIRAHNTEADSYSSKVDLFDLLYSEYRKTI